MHNNSDSGYLYNCLIYIYITFIKYLLEVTWTKMNTMSFLRFPFNNFLLSQARYNVRLLELLAPYLSTKYPYNNIKRYII